MGLACTVCNHPQRAAIDSLASLGTVSERSIAKQFNLNDSAVHRHIAKDHIARKLTKAVERAKVKEQDEFLDSIRKTAQRMSFGVSHGLQAARDGLIDPELAFRMVPAMAAQQLRAIELLGRATGRLDMAPAAAKGDLHLYINLPRTLAPAQPAAPDQVIETTCEQIAPPEGEERK